MSYNTKNYIKKVIYIDTDSSFKPERIIEIAENYYLDTKKILKSIFYAKAFNSDHQLQLIPSVASIASYANISMIIIDSCISLFRTEYIGRGELFLRQSLIGRYLRYLKKIAADFSIAVCLTNQIVAANLNSYFKAETSKPIGGNMVAHFTDTKIQLKKFKQNFRIFKVISSAKYAEKEVVFKISTFGLSES